MKRVRHIVPAALTMLVIAASVPAVAQTTTPVTISTHAGTGLEERGKQQLARLLQSWPLDPWIFTHEVLIQSRVIPHSHPVLTLNTRSINDDVARKRRRSMSSLIEASFSMYVSVAATYASGWS